MSAVAVLDVVPTGEVWARADARLALAYWPWAFLAQPAPLPERRIECPLLALWSARGALQRLYGDVLEVWRLWARDVTGRALDASHFLVKDRPHTVAQALSAFLASPTTGLDHS